MSIYGDWINNASPTFYNPGEGRVILRGEDHQAIRGDFGTTFSILELDGVGEKSLDKPVVVQKGMIFNRGRLMLNDQLMTWRPFATIGGVPADSSMIVINGDGVLRGEIDQVGAIVFPIGDITDGADYSPANITFSSGNFASGAYVEIGVTNQADPVCGGGNYIRRFWTVEMDGITGFAGNGSFRYTNGDVVGDESEIRTLTRDINSTDCLVGDPANTTSNDLTLTLSSTGFIITGGDKGALLPPGVQPTDLDFITITAESIEVGWTNGNGTGRIVLVKEDAAVDDIPDTNEFYTANSDFSATPEEIGTENFVVFNGTDNNFTLSGLDPKTRYHFSLFEYNDDGTFISYLTTSPLVGDALTMARFEITFTQERGWRMISLPLVDTKYEDVFIDYVAPDSTGLVTQGFPNSTDPNGSPNLLWYDETFEGTDNQRWRQPGDISDAVVPGKGYMYYVFGLVGTDDRYSVDLPINLRVDGYEPALQGNFNFDITYTETGDQGWNIIGNPYDDALDWKSIEWTKANIDEAIYVWDPNATGGAKYRVWSNDTGDDMDGIIARGQAFWVRANDVSPQLSVNRDAIAGSGTFYGKEPASDSTSGSNKRDRYREAPPSIEISVSKDDLSQSTWVMFSEDATRNIDPKDAWYLQPLTDTYVSVYTKAEGENFAINALPRRFNSVMEIPVYIGGFRDGVSMSGDYTLEMGELRNIPDSWAIEMVDTRSNQRVFWKYANDPVLYKRDVPDIGYAMRSYENAQSVDSHEDEVSRGGALSDVQRPDTHGDQREVEPTSPMQPLAENQLRFGLDYEREMRIQVPRPGEPIRMKPITGTSKSRFVLRIHPNGEFNDLPEQITLWQNYPNPFNPSTTIKFGLPIEEQVQIDVFDVLGRRVTSLASGMYPAGVHHVTFDARRYASGVYFVRMVAAGKVETKKMLLVK